MPTETISLRQANRFVLLRQHLLTPTSDPIQATVDACGLQAQVPSTPALSLRCRVSGFQLADYDRLLAEERSLVRTWAMRGTVHTLAASHLARYTQIYANPGGLSDGARLGYDLLAEGPATRGQLAQLAVERGLPEAQARELFGPWGGVLSRLARAGLTVHMPAPGADVPVVRLKDWLGYDLPQPDIPALQEKLLLDYLHGYGPATLKDFAHFAGLYIRQAKPIFARLADQLCTVRVEGSDEVHYLRPEDLPVIRGLSGNEPVPIHLLPRFDSLILVHRDKRRFLNEDRRRHVFGAGAQVEAVVLIDGQVAGTWKMKKSAKTLQVSFNPFGEHPVDRVRQAAAELAAWYGLDLGSFEVISEGPQAEVAARNAAVTAVIRQERPPRYLKQVAYLEPLREGALVHVPALLGFAAPPDLLPAEAERFCAMLQRHRIARPDVDPGALEIRPIRPALAKINQRPARETTALVDSDLIPLTSKELKWGARVLRALTHDLAEGGRVSKDDAVMFGWLLGRCTEIRRGIRAGASPAEALGTAVDSLVDGLEWAIAEGVVGTERAGEAWTPRKVLRRAIFYLWSHLD